MATTLNITIDISHLNSLQAAKMVDMGFSLLSRGDDLGARDYFSEVLTIYPGNPYALVNPGVTLEKEGRYEQAFQP